LRKLSWAYFDTSTYLKLYLLENGSEEARSLVSKYRVLSSAILLTECFSALSRKKEAEGVGERIFNQVVRIIREDMCYVEMINVTEIVLARAEEIVVHTTARALDAIHIASALTFQNITTISLSFITSDRKQYAVAATQGLNTIFVE